ncbi:hypothetical protein CT676_29400 [Bradyrhizobium sp. MOS001]|uniref:hypothetical protein n=1 Tax=Bradyrhizobium sp. MOS001 TaxID=2133948 RepID=UPI001074B2DF|nr:hypothetical protein [Bradyrhizobium sp. MOS001]TFW57599.1 hypothetical protein CT676_29400 [Bradyrhizobium sp. MOS001]
MKFDFRGAALKVNQEDFPAGFESSREARIARQRLGTALEQGGESGRRLAYLLGNCGLGPCRSAACPTCRRHFRLWWGSEISKYVAIDPDYWFTVSIVPQDLFFAIGELNRFNWDHIKDRLRKQIARNFAGDVIAVGAFDYALQIFDDGRHPKWRPHIYLLFQGGAKNQIERSLGRYYPNDDDTPRPIVVTPQRTNDEDRIKTATYSFKSSFYQRVPIIDRRGNADTEKRPLEQAQEAELALLLHRQGYLGRIIRYGRDDAFPLLTMR